MSGSFQPFSRAMRPLTCSCGKVTLTPITQRPTAADVTGLIKNRKLMIPNSKVLKIAAKSIRCESPDVNVVHISNNCFDVICQCGYVFRVFVKDPSFSLAQVGFEDASRFDPTKTISKFFPVPVRTLFNCDLREVKSTAELPELPDGDDMSSEMADICSVDCDFEVMFSKPKSAFVGSFQSLPALLSNEIIARK